MLKLIQIDVFLKCGAFGRLVSGLTCGFWSEIKAN